MPTKSDSLRALRELDERFRSDEALRGKMASVTSYQAFLEASRAAGYDLSGLSAEDLRALASGTRTTSGELGDEELAGVSGGSLIGDIVGTITKSVLPTVIS